MKLSKKVSKLIARERVCRVATTDADDNLRQNPHIALTIDLYSEEWSQLRGVTVQGTATLIERGPRFKQVRARLYEKYPQYPEDSALATSDSVIVEVTPRHVFSWGLD
jgi:nitroimidazol reductase NimA-like FMN-containing flavoprotein (pyridoxamine 5'-phosphate oxidase superfamily)